MLLAPCGLFKTSNHQQQVCFWPGSKGMDWKEPVRDLFAIGVSSTWRYFNFLSNQINSRVLILLLFLSTAANKPTTRFRSVVVQFYETSYETSRVVSFKENKEHFAAGK